ncbi:anti-sigma factor [Kribbella sp. NBC_00709]|uniref:anti-sigma factor n=1 Tax=Kribbella sp. NBC_00709 TaxID=2975972 RepID=UPI002E2DCD41|nr:anti-sigma factor [Kribbella sp. NBC_00709]
MHTLTGPYALDALPEDERIRFEEHLTVCTFCSTEVDELREAAVKLATQVATPPPPRLKADVMAAISDVRQGRSPVTERPGRQFSRRSMLALAAASLAAVTAGGVAIDQYRDKTDAIQANDRVAAVLAQPDARTVRSQVTGGGDATVVASNRGDAAVVVLHNLRKLPSNKTWQLWLIDTNQTPHSIGVAAGDLTKIVNGGITGKVAFGLTVEPEGGSARPTFPAAALISMT